MTSRELLRIRLSVQKLTTQSFKTPAEMVKYFGAVQAQDFLGSLWAVGQRVKNSTEPSVEKALNNRSIVRSWPLRGTLHFVAPDDLRWMLDLLSERAIAKSAGPYRDAGLTKKDFVKSRSIIEREIQGGKIVERNEIYGLLKRGGVNPSNSRGLHIIGHLAREKVICFGPRKGKQPTFTLLDEWVPEKRILSREEALAELTLRYFQSHGPASIHDFAWWAGVTVSEATEGLALVINEFEKIDVEGISHYVIPGAMDVMHKKHVVRLLPAYDEFLVGYHDRSASETKALKQLKDINSIFTSTVIANGHIVGIWKRTINNKGVSIKVKAFEKLSKQTDTAIRAQMKSYAGFLEQPWIPSV